MKAAATRWLAEEEQDATDAMGLIRTTMWVGTGAATILAIAMGMLLNGAIGRPIGAMAAAMKRLAEGDNTVPLPAVGRADEVGARPERCYASARRSVAALGASGNTPARHASRPRKLEPRRSFCISGPRASLASRKGTKK